MFPVDDLGRFDERGNQYEFGNEVTRYSWIRRVKVDPEKSFNYKITDYKNGIRDARNLFISCHIKRWTCSYTRRNCRCIYKCKPSFIYELIENYIKT